MSDESRIRGWLGSVIRNQSSRRGSGKEARGEHASKQAGKGRSLRRPLEADRTAPPGQHRVVVEIIARRATDIQSALASLREHELIHADAKTAIDVDPLSLL